MDMDEGGPVAVIADVHGNRWALEAVLEDLERRDAQRVLNLGDSLYGPLDPAGTAALFRRLDAVSVRGNQDRILLDPPASAVDSPTFRFVSEQIKADDVEWLRGHGVAPLRWGSLLLCHGTPERDDLYLIEQVTELGVRPKGADVLAGDLASVAADVILCGHSHVPRILALPDRRQVVNPGSVGLPAYTDDAPRGQSARLQPGRGSKGWVEKRDERPASHP